MTPRDRSPKTAGSNGPSIIPTILCFPLLIYSPSTSTVTMTFAWKAAGLTYACSTAKVSPANLDSYNRYLAVAARTVRRSLKDGPRLQSERRGQMDLRFAKWEVRASLSAWVELVGEDRSLTGYRTASRAKSSLSPRSTTMPWLDRPSRNKPLDWIPVREFG